MNSAPKTTLLDRIKGTNQQLEALSGGIDRREQATRAHEQATTLMGALAVLDRAAKAAAELRKVTSDRVPGAKIPAPPDGVSPLEWFSSVDGVEYVQKIKQHAEEYEEVVSASWTDYLEDLTPSMLDSALVNRMKETTDELDAACDRLLDAMRDWRDLPRSLPGPGDADRARQVANEVSQAWIALGESGATPERIQFLERVGQGRVSLTLVDDALLDWLRETGLAAQLFITSPHA